MLITARELIDKTRGIVIRAQACWHRYGEKKSYEYFLQMEN